MATPSSEVREPIVAIVYPIEGILIYLDRISLSDNTYAPSTQKIEELITTLMSVGRAIDTKKESMQS